MDENTQRSIAELSTHLAAVSRELAAEREARMRESKRGISIMRLHVPLPIMLGAFVAFAGSILLGGTFVHDVSTHMDNDKIHVNEKKALQFDGVAYAGAVKADIESKASDLEAAIRRNGRAVKAGAKCEPTGKKGAFTCAFADPEALPLR